MGFQKFVPSDATPAPREGRISPRRRVLSVPVSEQTHREFTAVAQHFGVPIARLAREALTIGMRVIVRRRDEYNRKVFSEPESD